MTGTAALPWRTAWITGASTGIGRELVLRLASQGVRVAATARSRDKLDALAALAPGIIAIPGDVTKSEDMRAAHAAAVRDLGGIDLAILNAGVWHPMGAEDYDSTRVLESMDVNYGGLVRALEPLIPSMIAVKSGHIALMASVAGYRGLPKAIAYGPSKAAAISLAEILRTDLEPHGVRVSVINPGFVETPMTAPNTFPMPFMIKTDEAVAHIVKGLRQQKFEIAFPWQTVTGLKLLRLLPYRLYFGVAGWMARR